MRSCCECLLLAMLSGVWGVAASPEETRRITTAVHPDYRTGKLVRSVIVTSQPVSPKMVRETVVLPRVVSNAVVEAAEDAPSNINEAVDRIAAQHALRPALIHSVIKGESNY